MRSYFSRLAWVTASLGSPLSALRRVFTSTNTSASSLTAMISASPAKQVQLRSRMV